MNIAEKTQHYENIVRQEWSNTTTINAWEQWADEQAVHCQPLTDAVIAHAQLSDGLSVLDLAGGVGEPSLSIAKQVAPNGAVTATDLSAGMLDIANRKARTLNISNINFEVADAHSLPFADNRFDRVVSRLGLMYFWDIEAALKEIHRVLKPGGIGSFVVWGAGEKNEYFGTILTPFMSRKEMPAPPADAPTPTRFADTTELAHAFQKTGFSKVNVDEYCEPLPWPGNPRTLFNHFYDVAVPMQPYIDSFSDEEQTAALAEIEQAFQPCWDGRYTRAVASFNAISVVK